MSLRHPVLGMSWWIYWYKYVYAYSHTYVNVHTYIYTWIDMYVYVCVHARMYTIFFDIHIHIYPCILPDPYVLSKESRSLLFSQKSPVYSLNRALCLLNSALYPTFSRSLIFFLNIHKTGPVFYLRNEPKSHTVSQECPVSSPKSLGFSQKSPAFSLKRAFHSLYSALHSLKRALHSL